MTLIRFFLSVLLIGFVTSCKKWEVPEHKSLVEMAFIKGGTFDMGSTEGDSDERPVHKVTVSDFYMGKYEITVGQYREFINESRYNYSRSGSWDWTTYAYKGENHPVVLITNHDAQKFCAWLSAKEGRNYRLPTEAEWEYAAGNGANHTKYSWGNDEPRFTQGNVNLLNINATTAVGSFSPNSFMLYDMSGNVWEMVNDYYSSNYYSNSPENNPTGPTTGNGNYVLRGGSFFDHHYYSRVTDRHQIGPYEIYTNVGFRIVATE